jgi:uncharacterized protein YkwD
VTHRRRRAAVLVVGLLVLLAACSPPVTSGSGGRSNDGRLGGLQAQVNASRARSGLGPLYWDDTLAASAQRWSQHLAWSNGFGHQDLVALNARLGDPYATLGEVLFIGPCTASSAEIHQALMNSPSHRSVILTPSLDVLGVGIVCTAGGKLYVVEDFGQS